MKRSNPRRPRRRVITTRDEQVVRLVHELRVATVAQIQLLAFSEGNRSGAQTRLGVLRQAGYLATLPVRAPNEPAIWVTTKRAREAFALASSADAQLTNTRVKYGRLSHDLAVNDIRVHFTRAVQANGHELAFWRDEVSLRPITIRHGVVPDALFQVVRVVGDRHPRSTFALEAEVSEKGERELKLKLGNFGQYFYGGRFNEDFGIRALRQLFLIRPGPGESGARQVKRVVSIASSLGSTLVRAVEIDAFLRTPPAEVFSASIWLQPGDSQPVPLFPPGGESDAQSLAA